MFMTMVKYRRSVASILMLSYFLMASHWGSALSLHVMDKVAGVQDSVLEFVVVFEEQGWDSGLLICNDPNSYVEDRQQDAKMIARMHEEAQAYKAKSEKAGACSSTSSCCCASTSFSGKSCACSHDDKSSGTQALFAMDDPCGSEEFFELSLKTLAKPELIDLVELSVRDFAQFNVPQYFLLEDEYEGSFIAELGKIPIAA